MIGRRQRHASREILGLESSNVKTLLGFVVWNLRSFELVYKSVQVISHLPLLANSQMWRELESRSN